MRTIDASAGGGQLVRTALALATLTREGVELEGIRANRPNPGLAPQHLAVVRLLAAIADADVTGAEVGAEAVTFEPNDPAPGTYDVDIGTAGSVTLLFDAVLPLAMALEGPLAVTATGGTDVAWSPSMDWYRHVKLPLLRRHGWMAAVDVDRRGFYPEGGGRATLSLAPGEPGPLALRNLGDVSGARVHSTASADLSDRDVAERQADAAEEGLAELGVELIDRTVEYAVSRSTGSALTLRLDRTGGLAGADALGERGKPAESIAADAIEQIEAALDSPASVDPHLADQLAVLLALGGGEVRIPGVTDHVASTLSLLERFDVPVELDESGRAPVLVA